ncbi:cation:proton antiporter [Kineosporia sp. NBRC 101731]|uniref:cation:proton antiporter n=1 Tax=Kineosporia sp. NBRC 101731 TaxID=3032199 RepID=UPI0024A40E71|nr:cation:proton antiporter [Kineosporia sp. NBRC 101731]GLY32783.1 transporter [Kineosporia sp. NBRC 101731]
MHLAETLMALGGAFLAAGLAARLGRRVGLPTIPLFMLAGLLLGPNTPGLALVEDPTEFALLSSLGLILLLFYLGLEFHLDDLIGGGRKLLAAGGIYLLVNVGLGLGFGFALGWGSREAFVLAGVIGISSSAIVTKVLVETGRLGRPESKLVLGIVVVEDVFLALYLALLQPVLSDASGFGEAAQKFGIAFGFLVVLTAVARWGAGLVGRLVETRDDELLIVTFVGLAVLSAGVAEKLGVSDAIGAFMIGLILGSGKAGVRIQKLVHPLRDAFAALFFFTFGLTIDPGDILGVWIPITLAVLVTVFGNLLAGTLSSRIYGFGPQRASFVSLTVLARGEFALILASMAAAAGLDPRITAFVAGYVLILAILGPLAASRSDEFAVLVEKAFGRWLPERPELMTDMPGNDDGEGVDRGDPPKGQNATLEEIGQKG